MATTMADVARLAGVSKATVSNALNNRPNVSGAVRARVYAACETLSYRVNAGIRDLARAGRNNGRVGAIGFVVIGEPFADPYTSPFMDGIARGAREYNQHLSIAALSGRETSVYDLPPALRDGRVDGLLMTGHVGASLDLLRSLNVPNVVLGNYGPEALRGAVSVEFDYDAGYDYLATTLSKAGKTRVAYIARDFSCHSERQEFEAFRRALTAKGLPVLPELMFIGGGIFIDVMQTFSAAFDRGRMPFDAVFTHDFKTADQLVHLWLGRTWPRPWPPDILVSTSRPYDYYRLPVPALYMDIRSDALAHTGCRVLMDILSGHAPAEGHRTLVGLDITRDLEADERYRCMTDRTRSGAPRERQHRTPRTRR